MGKPEILVIGGGPAGLAAATEAARAGFFVAVIEQRDAIGGAIYRQPIANAVAVPQLRPVKARWQQLAGEFAACRIPVRYRSVFLGIDGDGLVMVENRETGLVEHFNARAVIVATGAVEKIVPRPGWQLAGVSSVGALQVMMKETGKAPEGRILLAGNGPLLIAVAAQMARLGNPPVAVVEAGNPLSNSLKGVGLIAYPALLAEALAYLGRVYTSGVPWLRGMSVTNIDRRAGGLVATLRDSKGAGQRIEVDRIALHDGIRSNDFGLPKPNADLDKGPVVIRAGDCREALGAAAAQADGRRAGLLLARLLSGDARQGASAEIDRQRRAQTLLAALFAPVNGGAPLRELPDATVLCRCENRTVGDLKALCSKPDPLSGREIKHNGRFAMGACQGRFCADNTARLMAELRPEMTAPGADDITGHRWPLRPVSIGALVRASDEKIEQE